jgi:nuclear pore complex protein Nup155
VYRYLDDNASVDTISCKLRDVCPSLYRREDAACSKVRATIQCSEQNVILERRDLCQLGPLEAFGLHLSN